MADTGQAHDPAHRAAAAPDDERATVGGEALTGEEERPQPGGVDEGDLAEVDERHVRTSAQQAVQLGSRRLVELAPHHAHVVLVEHDLEHLTVGHGAETTSRPVAPDVPRTGELSAYARRAIVTNLSPICDGPPHGAARGSTSSGHGRGHGGGERTRAGKGKDGVVITVTMEGPAIRIRPVGRLDAETATTIAELLACARAAGTTAELDVTGLDPRDRGAAAALVTPASVA